MNRRHFLKLSALATAAPLLPLPAINPEPAERATLSISDRGVLGLVGDRWNLYINSQTGDAYFRGTLTAGGLPAGALGDRRPTSTADTMRYRL